LNLKPFVVLILTSILQGCQAPIESPPVAAESVFFLVRHAEKADESDDPEAGELRDQKIAQMMSEDPPLTEAGRLRAQKLAEMLRDAGIDRIYSSDTVRTRDTAAPLATHLDLEVNLYNPKELSGFAEELMSSPGRRLVVGHSNTTPELVGLLGGEPGPAIADDEYDRLYVLVYRPGVGTSTVLLRFEP
jgi:broad specificity phosphatase PhoE